MTQAAATPRAYRAADVSEPVLATTIGGVLRAAHADAPDARALLEGVAGARRAWTHAELLESAERLAHALLARFTPGERVAVWAPNSPEWVLLQLGAALAGVVLVPLNPALRARELRHSLRSLEVSGVFLIPEFRGTAMEDTLAEVRAELPALREVADLAALTAWVGDPDAVPLPEVSPDDPALILSTSGTTGASKGAVLTHRGITNNARLYAERVGLQAGDVYIDPMPLFHGGGCVMGVLGPLQRGAVHVSIAQFEPGLVAALIAEERASLLAGVPTMLIAVMEHVAAAGGDLSTLRTILSGGSTVPMELVRRLEQSLGVSFELVFGQTEASIVITQTAREDALRDKAETIGRPLPQCEVRIADPLTPADTVGLGETGEICARGYFVMREYYGNPKATAATVDAEGWLHTGDLGSLDARGYLTVEGRLKDMVIRGGENIYPREIEEALHEHPGVAECAVIGVSDARWGEELMAFVRPAAVRPSEEELMEHLRERLARHKVPKRWEFVSEWPLTPSGKIQKFVLRARIEEPT